MRAVFLRMMKRGVRWRWLGLVLGGFGLGGAELAGAAATPGAVADGKTEAMVVVLGDMHSAYEKAAQLVARVDRLKSEHRGVPLAVLIDGDAFEYNNVVARRTAGALDFALFRALAERGPLVVNLGNHEPEFYGVEETVKKIAAAGARVVGNVRDRRTGELFAPASVKVALGAHELTIVGITTDRLNTWRLAIRPELDLADPVVWAKEKFPELLRGTTLPVVLSHAGLKADRAILPLVAATDAARTAGGAGVLFAGAHDHLRFVHREGREGRTVYFHSGSWMEFVSVARLVRGGGGGTDGVEGGLRWEVAQEALQDSDPADPNLAAIVRTTLERALKAEEREVVGRTKRALAPSEAARFAVEAARRAAGADVAMIGGTTFGAGLPGGDVTRYAFDACVRFDGTLWVAEMSGAEVQRLLARCNQGPDTPFAARGGENLVAAGPESAAVEAGKIYKFVTSDWVAKNAKNYLGENPPELKERVQLKLKAVVIAELAGTEGKAKAEAERK